MIEYSFSIAELEYFLLVFTRVSCFIYIAPFFSMNNTPKRVRIGLAVFVSYLIYQVLSPHDGVVYDTLLEYAAIVIKEGLTGLLIGYGAGICNTIIVFAGRIIDMDIGLAMANQLDPTTKEYASVSGVLYQYLVMLLLLVSGMHRYILQALVETFTLIPINKAVFDGDRLLIPMLNLLKDYLSIGFRICLPIFCVMLIVNVVLGILAKVSPQMNMFAVGMQIKLLIGLGVMFLTVGMLPYISDFIFTEMKTMMVSFVEAMM